MKQYQTVKFTRESGLLGIKPFNEKAITDILNTHAKDGWQLVNVVPICAPQGRTVEIICFLERDIDEDTANQ